MTTESGPGLEEVASSEMSFHSRHQARKRGREEGGGEASMDLIETQLGIYGWRKRCLYLFLLLLLTTIVLNLGLTVWILVVMDFNTHGMGNLRVTDSGLRLQGRAEFTDTLYAQTIAADQDSPLLLQSQRSINITSGASKMTLSPNTVAMDTTMFTVNTQDSASSQPVLSVVDGQVVVTATSLEAQGSLGVTVEGGVETSSLKSPSGRDLSLEAMAGSVEVVGGGGVSVEGGFLGGREGVEVLSFGDLTLSSQSGSVFISGTSLQLAGLPVVPSSSSDSVMEVCVCASGRLFLVPSSVAETQGCLQDGGLCS